jgi:hypothetical protein
MTQVITWKARSKDTFDVYLKPIPASSMLPGWWRDVTPYEITIDNPEGKKIITRDLNTNATFKKCTPMLDAVVSGYLIPLWADVQISQQPGVGAVMNWRVTQDVFQLHGDNSSLITPPQGYSRKVFKYMNCWIPQTPPGYSVMVTHPLGHRDAPLLAVPAVIDSDKSSLELLFPMWVKEGFEGIVTKGTPLVQITPFKRTDWKSEFTYYENGEYEKVQNKNFNGTLVNHYIKKHWSKKTYK